jgi:hypothetical protein
MVNTTDTFLAVFTAGSRALSTPYASLRFHLTTMKPVAAPQLGILETQPTATSLVLLASVNPRVDFAVALPRVTLQAYGNASLLQQDIISLLAASAKVPLTYVLVKSLSISPAANASLTVSAAAVHDLTQPML